MGEKWKIEQPEQLAIGEGVRRLRLSAVGGRINVLGVDGPAALEVNRISGPPLNVELEDGELTVKHGEDLKSGLWSWITRGAKQEVELSISVPPDALVEVTVVSGPVVVSNFHERVTVKGVSGEFTLAGVYGPTSVSTVSGAVTVEQATDDLKVRAVSGSITVLAGAGGEIELNTVAGAITVDLEDPMPGRVHATCVSGALTVRLPHDPDVEVDISSTSGRATTAFPEITRSRQPGSSRLQGVIGSGAAQLKGHTVSGSITLLRREADEDADVQDVQDAKPGDTGEEGIEDAR
ncbi:DUF4097 family beta strand repeat protein [Actinospica sp. MGRD01-02]|uniref:DUF4097 family beta strand repeat protein n=1 Tax=Actinospica acidithermotolerans TaxID=2828514 RepID=A0A941IMP2_9ACTN|nr:DUF4097 family beta strand repeat-containing protein [Actinospica acidithermotolerans]MBR7828746.1 DUF4097 family beta strand repeat protein [Actinospica acidithermotolerans]